MSESAPSDPVRTHPSGATGNLTTELQRLTSMIRELEDQLDRLIEVNSGLRTDLEGERERGGRLSTTVDELRDRLVRSERENAASEGLEGEIQHLNEERRVMTEAARTRAEQLEIARAEATNQASLVTRYRAARDNALEDLRSVEAQFERAMALVAEKTAAVLMVREERDAFAKRLRLAEDQMRATHEDHDELLREVDESRAALDEIRRSLSDVVGEPSPGR